MNSEESCLFCKMIRGEGGALVVYESGASFVFLDHRPLFPGHCLLAPRRHYETLMDVPREELEPIFFDVQLVSRAVERALGADGVFVAINNRISQSVPHLHVHIVPRSRGDGLKGFFWPRHPYGSDGEAEEIRKKLSDAIEEIKGGPGR
ncbi:MAG: HIT family protein [Candidatus Latescibacteria bacterium 4484_7]|nr:MAG: HIT family protein [Candidatus Latescibacteria bacterium 4484_7]